MKFLNFIKTGLDNTNSNLGDRSTYVGSSDIGQCPKKVYLSKMQGESFELKQQLIFKRGLVAEGIIRQGLANNPNVDIKFDQQIEISGKDELSFIKTHIDFLVDFSQELVIIECKTISSPLPNNAPRESWIYQVQLQLGLLRQQRSEKSRAIIVVLDLNTGSASEYNIEFNQATYDIAIKRAKELWQNINSKNEPDGEISDLCAYCSFKGNCNSLRENAENLPYDIFLYLKRAQELKPLIAEEKAIKENIKAFMEAGNIQKGTAGDFTVTLSKRKGRESININELKSLYPEVAMELVKEGNAFTTLKIS